MRSAGVLAVALILVAIAAWSSDGRAGTDDQATALARALRPGYQPVASLAVRPDEHLIAVGLIAQGVCGAAIFVVACRLIRPCRDGRGRS